MVSTSFVNKRTNITEPYLRLDNTESLSDGIDRLMLEGWILPVDKVEEASDEKGRFIRMKAITTNPGHSDQEAGFNKPEFRRGFRPREQPDGLQKFREERRKSWDGRTKDWEKAEQRKREDADFEDMQRERRRTEFHSFKEKRDFRNDKPDFIRKLQDE